DALRRAFARYMSPRLVESLMAELAEGRTPFERPPERVDLVVLFADLRGFTGLTERAEADGVVALLNEYFTVMTEAAYRHDGTIFSMAGDSLLVGFNVPFAQPQAAALAWHAAHDMAAAARKLLARRSEQGMPTGVGFGLASGDAILANVGSPHYMNYTIIGDAVNVAARLVELAQPGELLIAASALQAARQSAAARGKLPLRGRSEPVDVYSATL
ncbi:MAG: adenylate/guanylate cyclase domain-containing protein, partial [Burkholderiales bacterium]